MYDLCGAGRNGGGHGKLPAVGKGHGIKRHAIFVRWRKVAVGIRHRSPSCRHAVDFYHVACSDAACGNHRLIECINGLDDFPVHGIAGMGNASALIERARKSNHWFAHAVLLAVGLLYYTVFRIYLLKSLLEGISRRSRRQLASVGLGLGLCFIAIACSESKVSDFFRRGDYNFLRVNLNLLANFLASAMGPFLPLPERYIHTGEFFMADYVHFGLSDSLRSRPALSYGISLLSLLGVATSVRRVLAKKADPLSSFLVLVGLTWLVLGALGPSLSRFLFLAPVWVIFAVQGYLSVRDHSHRHLATALAVFALALGAWDCMTVFRAIGQRSDAMETVFNGRFRDIDQWVDRRILSQGEVAGDLVFLFTDHGYFSARFLEEQDGHFKTYLPLASGDALNLVRYSGNQRSPRWVIFDRVPDGAETVSGFDKHARLKEIENILIQSGAVTARGAIEIDGQVVGRFLKLEWI